MSGAVTGVVEQVASNSDAIIKMSELLSNMFDIVAINGTAITGLKNTVNSLTAFTLQTSNLFANTIHNTLAIAADNANQIAYLERSVGMISERFDLLQLLTYTSLGLGVFNLAILAILLHLLTKKKK